MKSKNDGKFEEYLRQFMEDVKRQEAFYHHAAAYLGARRVVQDLEALNRSRVPFWRHVHPIRAISRIAHTFHRPVKLAAIAPEADYIDAELISDSDEEPSVIVIPPQDTKQ